MGPFQLGLFDGSMSGEHSFFLWKVAAASMRYP